MSTDRELLGLAAKAAGLTVNATRQAERDAAGADHLGIWTTDHTNWNPLTDDGHALCLAVKMGIEFIFRADQNYYVAAHKSESLRSRYTKHPRGITVPYVPESTFLSDDPSEVSHANYLVDVRGLVKGVEAATRRAIVRVAADIGKAVPA